MKTETVFKSAVTATIIAVAGAFLIMYALVRFMQHYTQPPPVDQARAEERRKALADIRAADASALENYAWQDEGKGFVRLDIERAMELTLRDYQSPDQARTNWVSRAAKMAEPPPKPPEPPNPYE